MNALCQESERLIREHERLIISREQYQSMLAEKTQVRKMLRKMRDTEIDSIRHALVAVEARIAVVEARLQELANE